MRRKLVGIWPQLLVRRSTSESLCMLQHGREAMLSFGMHLMLCLPETLSDRKDSEMLQAASDHSPNSNGAYTKHRAAGACDSSAADRYNPKARPYNLSLYVSAADDSHVPAAYCLHDHMANIHRYHELYCNVINK